MNHLRFALRAAFWFGLALAAVASSPLWSEQEGALRPRRWAVLIGVSQYDDPGIADLRFAAKDAQAVAGALVTIPHGGYSSETLRVLTTGGPESPNLERVRSIFDDLRVNVAIEDSVLLFVSSHGFESDREPTLVLADTRLDDLESTGLKVAELFRLLRSLPVKNRILVIDACHSGLSRAFPTGTMGFGLHDALEAGATGSAVLSSSRIGQESFESDDYGSGVFTHFLGQALRGVEGVDRDHDGRLSLDEAAIYVERGLLEWGREVGRVQQPWLIRTGSGSSPTLIALSPEVDLFGARLRSAETLGTMHFKYTVEKDGPEFVLRASIRPENLPPGRAMVSLSVVLEGGSRTTWRASVDPQSKLIVLPERRFLSRPATVTLEENLCNPELTECVPARVALD